MMFIRKMLLCAMISLGSIAMPAVAQIRVNIDIGVAPPAPRY